MMIYTMHWFPQAKSDRSGKGKGGGDRKKNTITVNTT